MVPSMSHVPLEDFDICEQSMSDFWFFNERSDDNCSSVLNLILGRSVPEDSEVLPGIIVELPVVTVD
jgi:hypothetical protein